MIEPEDDKPEGGKKLSETERQTWTSSDERQFVRSLIEHNQWLQILGGYNALMTFDYQWARMAEQAGEDAKAFRETYQTVWINAAIFAAKSCVPSTIPKEWHEAWKLLSLQNPGRYAAGLH